MAPVDDCTYAFVDFRHDEIFNNFFQCQNASSSRRIPDFKRERERESSVATDILLTKATGGNNYRTRRKHLFAFPLGFATLHADACSFLLKT